MKIHTQNSILNFDVPKIMGILNVTPDSFYDGGVHATLDAMLTHTEKMLCDGADIIDVGAYSSRPGAQHLSVQEELERIIPIVTKIRQHFPSAILSIDTFRAAVVETLFDTIGEFLVNDISGGHMDSMMQPTVGRLNLPYICMHMQGTPQTMAQQTHYSHLITDIYQYFERAIEQAAAHGIFQIIIDPGFGFGKTGDQNFTLLANLETFASLNKPILVGVSRKSMIYKTLQTTPEHSRNGSSVLHAVALLHNANILRVHDVKEAKECVVLMQKIKHA